MIDAAAIEHDANILEMKRIYNDIHGHSLCGRWASDSEWLTAQIDEGCASHSTSTPAATMVVAQTAAAPNVVLPIFGRNMCVGSTMMQVIDYPFGTSDKGMTFGTSTTNSVHIQTIDSDGVAATTSRQVL